MQIDKRIAAAGRLIIKINLIQIEIYAKGDDNYEHL
jgi:hypothetical protein